MLFTGCASPNAEKREPRSRLSSSSAVNVTQAATASLFHPKPTTWKSVGEERIQRISPLPRGSGSPPVRIQIPALKVDVAVKPVGWNIKVTKAGRTTEWEVLSQAAGHHFGSANPGEIGNVVISGHNAPGGGVFAELASLGYKEGPLPDHLYANITAANGSVYVYKLTNKLLLPILGSSSEEIHSQVVYIGQTKDARLTLVTCWPLGDTSYRLIVWGPLLGRER